MSTLSPVDHVARPRLPWRISPHLTECGKDLARFDLDRIITTDALIARIRDLGRQRAAYTTCMTCWETARRHRSDRPDPLRVIMRELEALRWSEDVPLGDLDHLTAARREQVTRDHARRRLVAGELEALGALVTAHRAEFDDYVAGLAETVSLTDRRATRRASRRSAGPGAS